MFSSSYFVFPLKLYEYVGFDRIFKIFKFLSELRVYKMLILL